MHGIQDDIEQLKERVVKTDQMAREGIQRLDRAIRAAELQQQGTLERLYKLEKRVWLLETRQTPKEFADWFPDVQQMAEKLHWSAPEAYPDQGNRETVLSVLKDIRRLLKGREKVHHPL